MSVISGDAVPAVCELEDQEVVGECLKVLRELFPEQVSTGQGSGRPQHRGSRVS